MLFYPSVTSADSIGALPLILSVWVHCLISLLSAVKQAFAPYPSVDTRDEPEGEALNYQSANL